MKPEQQKRFDGLLHTTLAMVGCLLGAFGLFCYLVWGTATKQIIVQNVPTDSAAAQVLRGGLLLGILWTFPLQMVPVIHIVEGFMMHRTGKLATWASVAARIALVCAACAVAVVFREKFGLFSAFVGAVGSTLLAYVLPSLFHVKIFGASLSLRRKCMDYVLSGIGVTVGACAMYVIVREMVNS